MFLVYRYIGGHSHVANVCGTAHPFSLRQLCQDLVLWPKALFLPPCIMSFRKRNVVIGSPSASPKSNDIKVKAQGTRASPVDGSLTTSTGTYSLDQLMAGHAGMPVGTSILVEEVGTTDFSGILLRYYAAEGLVQGHHVHVLGHSDSWRRELPGLATCDNVKATKKPAEKFQDGKMKIAWRYEALSNRADPKLSESCSQ